MDEDRQHALARGAFSFVSKPTTTEGVSAALSQIKEYAKPRRKRLLIVDDNAAERISITELLDHKDIEIVTTDTATGSEAVALVESNPEIAIVLMDIMMPQMDGYQTIGVIRENPSFRRLPIIALTAKAMKGDREKCLEAGASDYLAKPVNTEQLLLAIRMWLHR